MGESVCTLSAFSTPNGLSLQPDMYITELLHATAYKDNTLGLPLICPDGNVCEERDARTRRMTWTYMSFSIV